MTYEERVDENLFAVRALAFALLECRSEREALKVIKYFTDTKSLFPSAAEPMRRSDGAAENTR